MSAPFGAIVELPKVLRCGSRAASELLFFARAKKSNQKKRAPNRATAPGPDSLLGPTLSHAASCREGKSRTSMYATLRAFPKREPGPGALHGDLTFRTAATTALTSSSPLPVARPNGLLPLTLNPRRARPSAVAFWVSAPQGSPPWMAATIPRGRKPRGIARAPKGHSTWELSRVFGGVFLLGTFLCTSKEKYLARGARTAIINLLKLDNPRRRRDPSKSWRMIMKINPMRRPPRPNRLLNLLSRQINHRHPINPPRRHPQFATVFL